MKRSKRLFVDYHWVRYLLVGISLNFTLLGLSTVHGQDAWQGPTSNESWLTPGNWTLGLPTEEQVATVANGGNAVVDAAGATAATLNIDGGSTVQISPTGDLTLRDALVIGPKGRFLFNGGTVFGTFSWTDNGILEFDSSAFLNANVSGTGSFVLNIPGTDGSFTVSSANNTYGGGTILTAGTFRVNSEGALSPNSAFTVNSTLDLNGFTGTIGSLSGTGTVLNGSAEAATLIVGNDNTSTTFDGIIEDGTGPLQLTKSGTGTLTLTGANTYSGGTLISAGTLQIGNGGTTGSITGNVIDNGTLAFNRSDLVTFGGVISGTGNLVQQGSGTVRLTGVNTYTGTTTIDTGSLIVDGSISSRQTVVNSGASLGGHGTIGGNVVNNGTIRQSSSPGTLTVNGNFTQGAGATLQIGVGGLAAGQHDLLAVNGHAAVAGNLQFISLGGFALQPGDQLTFLTAKNGVSGTFSNVQNGLVGTGTIVNVQVTSLANSIVLEASQGTFASNPALTTTPNNTAVAKALDSARGDPREAALFAFLNAEPLANLPHDFVLIAPTAVSSINATAVSVGKVQISNVSQRLASVRGGSNGFSSAGFSINGGATSFGGGFEGVSGPEGKSGPAAFAPTPDNRWGVFLTGLGEFSGVDSTTNAAGYDVDTGGLTFGVDYRLTPNIALGLTGGYAHTSVSPDGGGKIDVNGGKLGIYATIFGNGFYLDTAASGGPSSYNTHRAALQGTASGSTDGADFNALVAAGYDWKHGNLSIGPTASFQFSYIGLGSFSETGSLAPLKFQDQNTESERTAFGAKASFEWKIKQITVIPQISAAWQHEFGATAYSVVSGFATGAGNNFTVTGPDIGRDSLLIGAGATVILSDRVSTYLFYDGEVARTNYQSHNVSGGVRISF